MSQTDAEISAAKRTNSSSESVGSFRASLCSRLELELAPEGNRVVE